MRTFAAACAVGIALAGCSGDAGAGTSSQPTMKAGSPAPSTPASSPTAAPTPVSGKIGDTYVSDLADITIESFNPHVTTQAGPQTWQAALIKTCLKAHGATVGSARWKVIDNDSGHYGPAGETYGDAPTPLYPMGNGEFVNQGECVKGWLLFGVSTDKKVTEVRYGDAGQIQATWKVQ